MRLPILLLAGLAAGLGSAVLARAQIAPAADAAKTTDEPVVVLEKFSVEDRITDPSVAIGTDRTRNAISITREALLAAPAGISGLKMLESLPGFNVQANDALGLYEFGNSVFVRAFNFQQIGFVLDGIPMGRSDQFGGSPIFRYVDNENTGRVTASQGAGDVTQPSYASLGPIVQYSTLMPAKEFGATLSQTLGSDELSRSFLKVQSGAIGGFSGYVSRSKIDSDLWRGPGTIDREHIEAKLRYELGGGNDLTFQMVYNDFFDFDTPSITKAQYAGTAGDAFGRSGREFGYLGYVPDLPVTVPGITYSNTLYNQYYLQAINQRTDFLYGLTGAFVLGDRLTLNATAYYEDKEGYGVSPEAYATSLASHNAQRLIVPDLFAPKGLQYGLSTVAGDRTGLNVLAAYTLGRQKIEFGGWVEKDEYHRTQNRFNQAGGNPAGQPLLNEYVHRQRDFQSTRDTRQLFVKDTISLMENRLKVELGVKALDIDYEISGYRNPGDYIAQRTPTLTDTWSDDFLPQVGAVFSLTPTEQLFASYAENLALPRGADDIFSQASPSAPGPEAETSDNVEIGIRTNRGTFSAALAAYLTTFDNRLQAFASPVPGSTTTETFFQNVGGVESYGAELSTAWRPSFLSNRVALNGSVTYNVAEFQDNYSTLAIAGNRLPDNAEWLVQSGVTWEPFSWLVASVSAKYLSDRYTNFVNSEMVGGYTTFAAYLDVGGDRLAVGPLKQVRFRLNVDNLTDKDYFGTINTGTTALASFRPGPARTLQLTVTAGF